MVTFHNTTFNMDDFAEAKELFYLNKDETSPMPFELDIDVFHYLNCQPLAYVARGDEGEIVGYSLFRVENHPHYNRTMAFQDVIYIHPDYRKGSTGLRFYKYIEKEISKTEAEAIMVSHTFQKDLGPLFTKMGYTPLEVTHIKEI